MIFKKYWSGISIISKVSNKELVRGKTLPETLTMT